MIGADPDFFFMDLALSEAEKAAMEGEVPVGAVITVGDRIVAKTHNLTERLNDVTAHAEMLAITAAEESLGSKFLPQCTLYVTIEPCPMCAGAIAWSRIGRVVFGAADVKRGYRKVAFTHSFLHPDTQVEEGIMKEEAARLMTEFFKNKR